MNTHATILVLDPETDEEFSVELEADAEYGEHGIGSYEFWGMKGYDSQKGWTIESEITWDKSKFTEHQNDLIAEFIDEEWEYVEEKLLDNIDEGDLDDYEPDYFDDDF